MRVDPVTTGPLRPASAMAAAEVRMGLDPIENLLDERQHLVEELATLRAKYGSFGVFDHIRKTELAQLRVRLRAQYTAAGVKRVTNDQLDDEAHAHPDYLALITQALHDRATWVRLEERLAAIDFTINRGQSVARFVTAELSNG
jgi:chorismate mutase